MGLVLTRKPGQAIVIDGDIYVTVTQIYGRGQVKLQVDAPRSVTVDREEIHEARKAANEPR